MELIKRNIHTDCIKCKAQTQMTLEDDVIISDSRPDAAKLIMDRGNVTIEEIKVTDDHVGVKGKLNFHVLYLTEQAAPERGDVANMEGAIPFDEVVFMEGIRAGDNVNVNWELEDLSVNLINSRKLSVQSLVTLFLSCEEIHDEETAVDLYSEEPIEFRKKSLDIAAMTIKKKDIFRIKEEVEIPGSFPNILTMIWSEIVPEAVEFKVLEDKIGVQGELRAFFLYRGEGEEGEICHYETTLPFAGSLDCPGAAEGMIPEIRFFAEDREVEVRPDFDGEERVITFEQCLDMDICIYEEEKIDILADVYGVVKEVSVLEKNADFRKLLSKSSGKTKLSGHFKCEDEKAAMHKILHTASNLQISGQNVTEGGIELTGVVNMQIFYECSTEENRYGVIKGTIPFSYVLEAEGITENCIYPVQAFVDQITVAIIDNVEVDVKCVLYFRSNVYLKWQEKIVEQVIVSEPDMEKMEALPGIAVYMVKDGESLWDIGKRYYVPVSVIKQTNELTSDEVKPGDRILIVKNV
ncbi:MAG: DUF3794 domain-containing protein [Clostridium sp.]|nr:DUF3794 domain-containing protein [Clostridium sp.]